MQTVRAHTLRLAAWPALALATLLGVAQAQEAPAPKLGESRTLPGGPARLSFQDEFSGQALDRSVWTTNYTSVLASLPNELQIYTPDNFLVSDGVLRIRTDNRKIGDFAYTSGAMTTFGSFIQAYGYFEMRAKLPAGNGFWPAFWLLPWDKSWPPEIDVMEFLGRDVTEIHTTFHWTDPKDGKKEDGTSTKLADWTKDYHIFAVDWRPGVIAWFIDGKEVKRLTGAQVPSMPMFMLLNTAVGGSWAGPPGWFTKFPSTYDIDWVRAWKYDDVPSPPMPDRRFLTTTADKVTAKPGDTVIFDVGLETTVPMASLIMQPLLVDVSGKQQIAKVDFRYNDLKPGRVTKRWPVKLPDTLPKGLYILSIGLFTGDWKQIDWLNNARTILVE